MFGLFTKTKTQSIHVNDLDQLGQNIQLIDIREDYEYANGSHKWAKHVPMNQLLAQPDKYLKKDKTYYIMCQSGMRSSRTTQALAEKGFNVINVAGGIGSYVGTNRK